MLQKVIRLLGSDPSKVWLASVLKKADVRTFGVDKYRRVLGTVYCDGVNANMHQVKNGLAWVYRQYASTSSPLSAVEESAKAKRLGLWADANPTAPWDWRHAGKNTAGNNLIPSSSVSGSSTSYFNDLSAVRGNPALSDLSLERLPKLQRC